MAIIQQGSTALEFLISETGGDSARDTGILIAGQNLRAATVLGQITASGKYTALAPAAVDGSQNAIALLCYATDASAGDRSASIIRPSGRMGVEVFASVLIWPTGITAPQRTAAIAALAAQGFKLR